MSENTRKTNGFDSFPAIQATHFGIRLGITFGVTFGTLLFQKSRGINWDLLDLGNRMQRKWSPYSAGPLIELQKSTIKVLFKSELAKEA